MTVLNSIHHINFIVADLETERSLCVRFHITQAD